MVDIGENRPLQLVTPVNNSGVIASALAHGAQLRMDRQREESQAALQREQLEREKSRDARYDSNEKATRAQRERELTMADQRERQRIGLAVSEEGRRAALQRTEEEDKKRQEREQVLREYQAALQIPDPQARASALHFAADAMRRNGLQIEEYGQQFGNPAPTPAPAAPALAPSPNDGSEVGDLQNGITPGTTHAQPPKPMLPGEAASIGRQLDSAGNRYMRALTGKPLAAAPKPADAGLSRQLDAVDARYMGALQAPTARPPLPGQSPFSVVQSNQMLSPGDPYNNIR